VGHVNGQHYQTEISLLSWESVAIRGDIVGVGNNPVGQKAELVIVASYTLLGPNMAHNVVGTGGQVQLWDGQITSLVAASEDLTLKQTQPVDMVTGPLVAGRWNGFFGYRLRMARECLMADKASIWLSTTTINSNNDRDCIL
jgi:hypothetical protein